MPYHGPAVREAVTDAVADLLRVPAGDLAASPSQPQAGNATDPNLVAIQPDGWRATHAAPPAFDPVGNPKYAVVQRPGYDAGGNSVTVTDDVLIMSRVRQPYPNQAALTASDVALQDFVHAGDTVAGVTNNSTRPYPRPVAMWLDHDMRRITGTDHTARIAVSHAHARNGRPVAAVRFIASDGVNPDVEVTVSTMSRVTYAASGLSIPCFEAVLDLSSLSNDTPITIDAVIYPWVGDAPFRASADFASYPSINFCEMKVVRTSAPIYAYVDTGGSDGTGVAGTAEAAAQASPFATVTAAAAAIQAADGTDASRGIVKLNAGIHAHASLSSVTVGSAPLIIEAANPADKATTIYRDAGTHSFNSLPDRIVFRNLTLRRSATGDVVFLDSGAGAGSTNFLVTEGCIFDDNGAGTPWGAYVYEVGRTWLIDTSANFSIAGVFGTSNKMCNLIGWSGSTTIGSSAVYHVAASRLPDSSLQDNAITEGASGNKEGIKGQFIGHSFIGNRDGATVVFGANRIIGADGLSLAGSIIENAGTGPQSLVDIGASGTVSAENVILHCSTLVGGRSNVMYNDHAPFADKYLQARFCVFSTYNVKSDVFVADGNGVLNWKAAYKIGHHTNAMIFGDDNSDVHGAGSWLGEFPAVGEIGGSDASPVVTDWANDQSADSGGTGEGDYTPGTLTALPTIPVGQAPHAFDLHGNALNTASRIGAVSATG